VIAILSSRDRLQTALLEAQAEVNVAQASLATVQAGAKQGEITAQQAEIARLEADREGNLATQTATVNRLVSELQNAETEFNRYQSLFQDGAFQPHSETVNDSALKLHSGVCKKHKLHWIGSKTQARRN
jgi:HlyD family secretion protein